MPWQNYFRIGDHPKIGVLALSRRCRSCLNARMVRSSRLMVAGMAALAALSIFLPAIHAQDAAPKTQQQDAPEIAAKKAVEADLGTRKKTLLTQSQDLESLMKSLRGQDFDNAAAIDDRALQGVGYLDASFWFVLIYNRMQCDEDKTIAKAVLQNRLGFYAHLLDMAVDQTNGSLGLTRMPAVAQQGEQIRNELRAAKVKLDDIAASLK